MGIGGGCGSSGNSGASGFQSSTSQSTASPPPQVMANYQNLVNRAIDTSNAPLQQWSGPTIAGFNPTQDSAFASINNAQGMSTPYTNAAAQYAAIGAAPVMPNVMSFNPTNLANFQNPYTQQVTQATQNLMNQQDAIQQSQLQGNAVSSGAWGGDRAGVAQAQLAENQALANNSTLANIQSQGFNTAAGLLTNQQNLQLQGGEGDAWRAANAAYELGGLGTQAESNTLQGAQAQLAAGDMGQSLQQQEMNVPIEEFMQQQAYPFQTTNWLSGIEDSTLPGMGTMSTTTTPGPNAYSQLLGQVASQYGSGQFSPFGLSPPSGGGGGSPFGNILRRGGRAFASGGDAWYSDPDLEEYFPGDHGSDPTHWPSIKSINSANDKWMERFKNNDELRRMGVRVGGGRSESDVLSHDPDFNKTWMDRLPRGNSNMPDKGVYQFPSGIDEDGEFWNEQRFEDWKEPDDGGPPLQTSLARGGYPRLAGGGNGSTSDAITLALQLVGASPVGNPIGSGGGRGASASSPRAAGTNPNSLSTTAGSKGSSGSSGSSPNLGGLSKLFSGSGSTSNFQTGPAVNAAGDPFTGSGADIGAANSISDASALNSLDSSAFSSAGTDALGGADLSSAVGDFGSFGFKRGGYSRFPHLDAGGGTGILINALGGVNDEGGSIAADGSFLPPEQHNRVLGYVGQGIGSFWGPIGAEAGAEIGNGLGNMFAGKNAFTGRGDFWSNFDPRQLNFPFGLGNIIGGDKKARGGRMAYAEGGDTMEEDDEGPPPSDDEDEAPPDEKEIAGDMDLRGVATPVSGSDDAPPPIPSNNSGTRFPSTYALTGASPHPVARKGLDFSNPLVGLGAGMMASKSPFPMSAFGEGMLTAHKFQQERDQQEINRMRAGAPKADNSGDTIRLVYPDGRVFDTGMPTSKGADRDQRAKAAKDRTDTQRDIAADRVKAQNNRTDAIKDHYKTLADHYNTLETQGSWKFGDGDDPEHPGQKTYGLIREPKYGDTPPTFYPGWMVESTRGPTGTMAVIKALQADRESARQKDPSLPPLSTQEALGIVHNHPDGDRELLRREGLAASMARQAANQDPSGKTKAEDVLPKWRMRYGLSPDGSKMMKPEDMPTPDNLKGVQNSGNLAVKMIDGHKVYRNTDTKQQYNEFGEEMKQ